MRHFLSDLDLVDCILVHIFLMFWDISYTTIHEIRVFGGHNGGYRVRPSTGDHNIPFPSKK